MDNECTIAMEWIKVTDRLPENEDTVLVVSHIGEKALIELGRYLNCMEFHGWDAIDSFLERPCNVTHWMPLPELPK